MVNGGRPEKVPAHVGRLVEASCSLCAARPNPMNAREMRTVVSRARRQPTSFPT